MKKSLLKKLMPAVLVASLVCSSIAPAFADDMAQQAGAQVEAMQETELQETSPEGQGNIKDGDAGIPLVGVGADIPEKDDDAGNGKGSGDAPTAGDESTEGADLAEKGGEATEESATEDSEGATDDGNLGMYLVCLPEDGTVSYAYDAARKPESQPVDGFTTLAYAAGEDVWFSVDPSAAFTLVSADTGMEFLSCEGEAAFQMPEMDLVLTWAQQDATGGEGANEPATEAATDALDGLTYVCGMEEHVHTAGCYNAEGYQSCGMEEHTHTEACLEAQETEMTEAASEAVTEAGTGAETETEDETEVLVQEHGEEDAMGMAEAGSSPLVWNPQMTVTYFANGIDAGNEVPDTDYAGRLSVTMVGEGLKDYDDDGNEVTNWNYSSTATNAEGALAFTEVSFPKAGQYTFTFKDIKGIEGYENHTFTYLSLNNFRYNFDLSGAKLTVSISDDEEGGLYISGADLTATSIVYTDMDNWSIITYGGETADTNKLNVFDISVNLTGPSKGPTAMVNIMYSLTGGYTPEVTEQLFQGLGRYLAGLGENISFGKFPEIDNEEAIVFGDPSSEMPIFLSRASFGVELDVDITGMDAYLQDAGINMTMEEAIEAATGHNRRKMFDGMDNTMDAALKVYDSKGNEVYSTVDKLEVSAPNGASRTMNYITPFKIEQDGEYDAYLYITKSNNPNLVPSTYGCKYTFTVTDGMVEMEAGSTKYVYGLADYAATHDSLYNNGLQETQYLDSQNEAEYLYPSLDGDGDYGIMPLNGGAYAGLNYFIKFAPKFSAQWVPQFKKELKGAPLEAGKYTFTLACEKAGYSESATNAADGAIKFRGCQFTGPGVYNFTVSEAKGTEQGVAYDDAVYGISVDVATDGSMTTTCSVVKPSSLSGIVTVSKEGDIVFVNEYAPQGKTGSLAVKKTVTGYGNKDKEWHFTVKLEQGITGKYGDMEFKDGVASFTLKHGGEATAKNLPLNVKYEVTEQEANSGGYVTTWTGNTGTITENGAKAEFVNDLTTTVELRKVDVTTGEELEGAHLKLTDEEGNTIEEWVSTKEAHVVKGLAVGKKYILVETKPADGYVTAQSVEFVIQDTGEVQKYKMEDDVTKVKVSKTDITGEKELAGAKLSILDKDGNVVDSWTSTNEAHYVEKLAVGTYTLHEETAPDGYLAASDITFKVKDTGKVQKVHMVDERDTVVELSKTDLTTGEELEGAHLQVTDEDGNVVEEWVSTKEAHKIHRLEVGKTYTMTETKPADGYVTAQSIEFTIKDTGKVQKHEMKDDVTKLKVSKTDITGDKELAGAKLSILDKDGNVVESWTSTDEAHYVEKLAIGKYTLHEESAPDGYLVASDVEFEIKDTGKVQTVTMKDEAENGTTGTTAPATGDTLNSAHMARAIAAALVLFIAGAVLIVKGRKRKGSK